MKRKTRYAVFASLVLVAVLGIGLVGPMFIRARLSKPYPLEYERKRNLKLIYIQMTFYRQDEGSLPYSPSGPREAIELFLTKFPNTSAYMKPIGTISEVENAYIYLNPEPDSILAPDTIIMVESGYFYDDGRLLALSSSGEISFVEGSALDPDELPGKEIHSK